MKIRLLLALIVVFLSGLIIGFFAGQDFAKRQIHQFIKGGPEPMEHMLVSRLTELLGLSRDQIPAIQEKVVLVTRSFQEDRVKHGEIIRARMTELLNDIRPLLNETQQRILDKMDADDLRPGPPPRPPMGKGDFRHPLPPPPDDFMPPFSPSPDTPTR
jgi:uncharacterized protein YneF (UPF0154 family)